MPIELTDSMIRDEIREYEQHIKVLQAKLIALPSCADSWKDRKKLRDKKRVLEDDINHTFDLIQIAKEALEAPDNPVRENAD